MIETSPALIVAISSLITGIATYFGTRKKNSTDAFKALIDANEKFRDEVRKDLELAKNERDEYKVLVETLEDKIDDYMRQISELKIEIIQYQKTIVDLKDELGLRRKMHTHNKIYITSSSFKNEDENSND